MEVEWTSFSYVEDTIAEFFFDESGTNLTKSKLIYQII